MKYTPAIMDLHPRNVQMRGTYPQWILHNIDSGLYQHHIAKSYHRGCIGQIYNIPGLQQPNIIKQRRPSIKFQKNSKSENNITNGNNNHDKDFNNRKNDSEYNGSNKITIIVVK